MQKILRILNTLPIKGEIGPSIDIIKKVLRNIRHN